MGSEYYITDYCAIRDQSVIRKEEILFRGKEENPAAFFTEIYKHFGFNYPKFYKMDTLCKSGYLASEIILQGKDVAGNGDDFGVILYNSASSMDTDRIHQQSINDRQAYFPSPSVFVYTLPNIVIGEICIRHKFYGESALFVSQNYEPGEVYNYIKSLFDDNVIQRCLTGWIDCDGGNYDCNLLLVEKTAPVNGGFLIFDTSNIRDIYLH